MLFLFNSVVAVSYYWTLEVPSEKRIFYSAKVYVNGTQWSNATKLTWENDTKELDVLNLSSDPCIVTVTAEGLPANWNLTWAQNGKMFLPGAWLNGTLTLQHTSAPGNYSWTMLILLTGVSA